jgi:hypothetical protein
VNPATAVPPTTVKAPLAAVLPRKSQTGSLSGKTALLEKTGSSVQMKPVTGFKRLVENKQSDWLRPEKPKIPSPIPRISDREGKNESIKQNKAVGENVEVERMKARMSEQPGNHLQTGIREKSKLPGHGSAAIKRLLLLWDEIYSENEFEKIP